MTTAVLLQALGLVLDPHVLLVIFCSALFGLFVGCIPGLTATMATALLVPITFFMPPVPAVAAIVTATAMAIFSGDIPGALLRIPGTPASAAYTDESYRMTLKGQAELALGAGLVFSAIGGLFGTIVMILFSPALAEIALKFSSFEYFWLVVLGLAGAVFIGNASVLKACISLLLGLLIACIGLENPAAHPLHHGFAPVDERRGTHPHDGGHVRHLRVAALHHQHGSAGGDRGQQNRKYFSLACGTCSGSTAGLWCAAALWERSLASSPDRGPTWPPG